MSDTGLFSRFETMAAINEEHATKGSDQTIKNTLVACETILFVQS